jgi:diguanylate cyclase (GGDEF)-like protein/PAS domain S-box-containing protein
MELENPSYSHSGKLKQLADNLPNSVMLNNLLESEQVTLSYQTSFIPVIGSLFTIGLLAIALVGQIEILSIVIWLGMLASIYMFRFALIFKYQSYINNRKLIDTVFWKRLYFLTNFASGLIWSLGAIWVMPENPIYQIIIVLVIGGLCAAATATHSALRFSAISFILPALLPLCLFYALKETEYELIIAGLIFVFGFMMSIFSDFMHKQTSHGLISQFENKNLIRELQQINRDVFKLNQELQQENQERQHAEERFKRLAEASSEAVIIHHEGIIIDANEHMSDLTGYSNAELIGMNVTNLVQPESVDALVERVRKPSDRPFQLNARTKDNRMFPVEMRGKYVPFANGMFRVVLIKDLTVLVESEKALKDEKERALVTLESIGDGVVTTDAEGVINYINPVTEELSGWYKTEAVGHYLADILRLKNQVTGEVITDPVSNCLIHERKITLNGEINLQGSRNHHNYSIEVTIAPIRNEINSVVGTVLVFHDVTVLHNMAQQMSHQAAHDSLTGLINRQAFEQRLLQLIGSARKGNQVHAMCYLDLDEFKVVNDTSGHEAGDRLLKDLSKKLLENVRDTDTLARLGGDEFGVLLQSCPIEKAMEIADDMRKAVKSYRLSWDKHVHEVGVSIGLVPINEMSGELTDVLRAADSACYVAKDHGRNRVHVYEKDDAELAKHHGTMRWMQKIQKALSRNDFTLYYQPIQASIGHSSDVLHVEILIRMLKSSGEPILPQSFIPAAERYHLMSDIDRWVIEHTFEQLKRIYPVLNVSSFLCSINLSGQSLSNDTFLEYLILKINESQLEPEILCFEITETAAISNIDHAQRFVNVLRGMGCQFSLDDFGSGLSSFTYLKRLTVDYLKIDGSFVRNICQDKTDLAMVKSIHQIGKMMGIKTIAEFVENEEIANLLRELGVDYLQGYGIGKPMPLDTLLDDKTIVKVCAD